MLIIHTSDTHNKLTCEKADFLKSLGADFYFDSGDIIKSGNVDFNPLGEKAWSVYNGLYDCICPGNREYHFLKIGFDCKTKGFEMPLVTCNYVYKYDNPRPKKYVYFNNKGIKIGVFGLSNINIDETMACEKAAAQYQKDIFSSAAETIAEMDCDYIIALTHIGLKKDKILAEKFPKIDLILGGHSHDIFAEKINETYVVHSGSYAETYSIINTDSKDINVSLKEFSSDL